MPENEQALRVLSAQLAARDERERLARLERARAERLEAAGPEPQPIQSSPRGTFPVMRGEAAPSRPATMMVPSRSTYDEMGDSERFASTEGGVARGVLATTLAGAALAPALAGASLGLPLAAADIPMGAAIGGGGGLTGGLLGIPPYAALSSATDRMAGRVNRTSPTAGRFTPGPRVQEELESSYFPEQHWTRRMGISGEAVPQAAIEAAGERVAARRAQERAAEDEVIAAREREAMSYRNQLRRGLWRDEAAEAARQRRLTETFGTPSNRAEDILALEASKMKR